MRRSNVSSLSVIALVVVAMAFIFGYLRVEAQSPVGSGFTYQGRMFDASNAPVQGTCDLALRLYDHDSGGAQIGATVTITSVAMTDGYFDVAPDFGAASFNGEARWLEVDAACPPGAGATTFPRQAINVVPYALYALNSAITSTVYVTESLYYTPTYHLQGWDTITGTPGTYTPTAHTQDWGTITDQPAEYTPTAHTQGWTTITDAPSTYTPTAHTQDWTTIFGAPGTYTPTAHTQDWTTITGQPSTYTPTAHTQDWTTILNQPSTYTPTAHTQEWTTITGSPGTYTPTAHTQAWSTITSQPSTYTPTLDAHIWTGLQTFNFGAVAPSGQYIHASTDGSTGGFMAGSEGDALWYRGAADTWRTSDSVIVDGNVSIGTGQGYRLDVAGDVRLSGANSNTIFFGKTGVAAPGADSVGEKIQLYGTLGSIGASDYAIGIEGATLWFNTASQYKWYINSSQKMLMDSLGNVFLGHVLPNASNTYDLGSAANYWATIHYHTLTSHSLSVFSTTVTLQDGRDVSCLDALYEIKADPTKKIKGVPHMDYATIPSITLNTAPWVYNGSTLEKNGEDGADLDMMVSLTLCAARELDAKSTALDNRMSDFEKRLADLELKVK